MNRATVVIASVAALIGLCVTGLGLATRIYHQRRFEACAQELDAAVRSGRIVDAFIADERRGWYQTYSYEQRRELLDHVKTRGHTDKDYSDAAVMSARAHRSGVFNIGDMVYVLFFDRDNRLREFVCLSN
jgi:hypothetical protein